MSTGKAETHPADALQVLLNVTPGASPTVAASTDPQPKRGASSLILHVPHPPQAKR